MAQIIFLSDASFKWKLTSLNFLPQALN